MPFKDIEKKRIWQRKRNKRRRADPVYRAKEAVLYKKYRQTHGEQYRKWRKNWYYKKKMEIVEYFGGKCEKCGYNKCIAALDVHHKNGDSLWKERGYRAMVKLSDLKGDRNEYSFLCANCHREWHYNQNHGLEQDNP